MKLKFEKGEKFHRLTIIEFSHKDSNRKHRWLCQCECGNTTVAIASELKSGHTKSCGCYKSELINSGLFRSHDMSGTKVHRAWKALRKRCNNKNIPQWDDYGGRGIVYDSRWESFEEFYKDMGDPPSCRHSLDRIDVNGNYELSNCRWTVSSVQNTNKRNTIYTAFGGTIKPLKDWCTLLNFKYSTAYNRHHRGWVDEDLFIPLTKRA